MSITGYSQQVLKLSAASIKIEIDRLQAEEDRLIVLHDDAMDEVPKIVPDISRDYSLLHQAMFVKGQKVQLESIYNFMVDSFSKSGKFDAPEIEG